jgi:hypothetical protein
MPLALAAHPAPVTARPGRCRSPWPVPLALAGAARPGRCRSPWPVPLALVAGLAVLATPGGAASGIDPARGRHLGQPPNRLTRSLAGNGCDAQGP